MPINDLFLSRHLGPSSSEIKTMLARIGFSSLDELSNAIVPKYIQSKKPLNLKAPLSETEALTELKTILSENKIFRSYIGMGYYNCVTPSVIQRNILENPGWYTQYTPYQPEISQGRLEALLNFQTMVADLTGLPIANASLLDEATAAAEAMSLCFHARKRTESLTFFISELVHPQVLDVLRTRAEGFGIHLQIGNHLQIPPSSFSSIFGIYIQNPGTTGTVLDLTSFLSQMRAAQILSVVGTDLLYCTLFKSPGEMGADIAVGSSQRLGIPLGFGGPHAAFFSTRPELQRLIPGRIVGLTKDKHGRPALRLALQTREQHIRRDKATSNICTAQVLLAVMSSMYAVYHGPQGLKQIAQKILEKTARLKSGLLKAGFTVGDPRYPETEIFDTLIIETPQASSIFLKAQQQYGINLRLVNQKTLGLSLDETVSQKDLSDLESLFEIPTKASSQDVFSLRSDLMRSSSYLQNTVFNSYHCETEFLRYVTRLQNRDLSLTQSMIPLGSCTMKLNATSEMLPVSWPEVNALHPLAPRKQISGYLTLLSQLEKDLAEITGFEGISLQPNAGSQGEYAGLWTIRRYYENKGETSRNICLIPRSAHGTNPASAVMVGMKVVVVECDKNGNIDINDLRAKSQEHQSQLAALMVTYPSTHGVFEDHIGEICQIIHDHGGQVYMDGANMNAQVGLCRPGDFGPDVCHLNLHKTFCIPHGGGGPGVGPIGVKTHLKPYLPSHFYWDESRLGDLKPDLSHHDQMHHSVSAAPWGSASILVIPWMYLRMMGASGLRTATQVALLSANYLGKQLEEAFPILYKSTQGLVAHECIFDLRALKASTGVEVQDVAKRLMDYGFHAPTVSFPVPGTLMVEPTESESKAELDRFVEAMLEIRKELAMIEKGTYSITQNPLKGAPHTAWELTQENWDRPYSREKAIFPTSFTRNFKFWPSVSRIDEVAGDRNLICVCPTLDAYS